MQETNFKQLIIFKVVLFVLIIIWGGTEQMNEANNSEVNNLSTIRDLLVALFSFSYFFCFLPNLQIKKRG